jgi:phosphohistidine phosphatase
MKKLFVVRHAKSSWDNPSLDDIDRPLNKRGKRNAPEMGQRLAQRDVMPDLMLSSPAKRALSTAKRIAKEISYPKEKIVVDDRIYHGTNQEVIDVLREQENALTTIMIFGHNPGFTDLVNHLSDSSIYNIPTCGLAEIDFDIVSWEDIGKSKGQLIEFDYPKKISAEQE